MTADLTIAEKGVRSPVIGLAEECVPVKKGACTQGAVNRPVLAGKRKAKAEAFWKRLNNLRRMPGHCNRCGRPHKGWLKQCDHCREYHKQYKAVRFAKRMRLNMATLAQWNVEFDAQERRIGSLEIAVARLQLDGRNAYQRGYRIGFAKGRNGLARNLEGLRGEHSEHRNGCRASREELKVLNHAYA